MEGVPGAKPGKHNALIESIAPVFHRQCLFISAIGFHYFVHRRHTTMNPYPALSVKRFAMKWGQGGVIGMVLVAGISPRNILPA